MRVVMERSTTMEATLSFMFGSRGKRASIFSCAASAQKSFLLFLFLRVYLGFFSISSLIPSSSAYLSFIDFVVRFCSCRLLSLVFIGLA
jgi:hypothetical protein